MKGSEVEKPVIQLDAISLKYNTVSGEINVLNNIDMNIYEHEFICVLGASGCGKTSLLNIIAGFTKPTTGIVKQDDVPIDGVSWMRGVIFQEANLFPWLNVEDNVAFGLKMRDIAKSERLRRVDDALDAVGLYEYKNKYIYELSGGMIQRVGLARVLANNPEIILMDEPFGSLDAITRESMQRLIRKIWNEQKKTILFITHDVDEALVLGTRIIVLGGRPSKIIESIKSDYTYAFLDDSTEKERYTDDYYKKKQSLIMQMQRVM